MPKYWAGIGSRQTPPDIQKLMTLIAGKLAADGWILRSGHADGADWAFEQGAGPNSEIYLPWNGFNRHYPVLGQAYAAPTIEAINMASELHPAWKSCSQGAQKLHARNVHQVLGRDLETPVRFVVCWTKNGEDVGGTAQAIRLARWHSIDVFNLAIPEHKARLERFVAPAGVVA